MASLVFLVDIDNTLINNDRVAADMSSEILRLAGEDGSKQFWNVYEVVREELGYVDVPVTLRRFRTLRPDLRTFPQLSEMLLGYPFENDLYPHALEVVEHLKKSGTVVVLSDGDPVFQPAKIARIGVADAVDNNVLVYAHKEQQVDDIIGLYPADHYVLIDDKPDILAKIKHILGDRVTTIHVRQGKYAQAQKHSNPPPDTTLDAIADVLELRQVDFGGRPPDPSGG